MGKFKAESVECELCSKVISVQHLPVHMERIHLEGNEIKCPTCEKEFKGRGALAQHIWIAHKSKKDKKCPNECEQIMQCLHLSVSFST